MSRLGMTGIWMVLKADASTYPRRKSGRCLESRRIRLLS